MPRDFSENDVKYFNPWRPSNQLPFPAVSGMILLTKSDFTMPARPDLLEWKKVEEVIGVYDVSMEIAEDGLSATFYKIVNLEKIEIGTIGIVTRPEAEKLKAIKYVYYYVEANTETHEMRLFGKDKDDNVEQIGDVISYVSMLDINRLDNLIATETAERTAEDTRIDARIDTETTERTAEDTRINTRIDNEIQDRMTADEQLANDITLLQNRATALENRATALETNQNEIILPIVNILRTATNPELVLVKDVDGVGIRWANRLGIDGIEIQENATNNIITFYQFKNGVRQQVGQIDKFNYQDFETWKRVLEQIADDLNESSESGYILAKLQDGDRYDWQDLNDLITFTKVDGNILDTITITINNDTSRQFTFKVINEIKLNEILQRLGLCESDIQDIKDAIGDADITEVADTINDAILILKQEIIDTQNNMVGYWYGTQEEYDEDPSAIPNNSIIILEEN